MILNEQKLKRSVPVAFDAISKYKVLVYCDIYTWAACYCDVILTDYFDAVSVDPFGITTALASQDVSAWQFIVAGLSDFIASFTTPASNASWSMPIIFRKEEYNHIQTKYNKKHPESANFLSAMFD